MIFAGPDTGIGLPDGFGSLRLNLTYLLNWRGLQVSLPEQIGLLKDLFQPISAISGFESQAWFTWMASMSCCE